MHGYMFRSKLGALVFVAFILLAVFRMVGTEEDGGQLAAAKSQFSGPGGEPAATDPTPQSTIAGSFYSADDGVSDWGAGAHP